MTVQASWRVAVTDSGFPDLAPEAEALAGTGAVLLPGQCRTAGEVAELCADADAVLTQWAPVTAEAIERMTRCKVIVRYGIGVDNVDLEAARAKGIPVANVPDYAIEEVADHAMSLLLASVRKIPQVAAQVREGVWEIAPRRPIVGLQGRKLGVAGFGNIARAVVRRAQAFGLQTIAYDPYANPELFAKHSTARVDWETLLAESDFISVHLPLVEATRRLLDDRAFAAMKPGAHLVNTSRGGVVDTEALVRALMDGKLAGAALDVLEEEPVPAGHPLLAIDSCILTSHCAWYSESSLIRLQRYAALEVRRVLEGGRPQHVVNGVGA
ncbi:C-terminal binding protein [Cohnella hashimotonis]|uniref:C-terminal binding protein n=1 Tax=Cohnella hashimotonis TaxID=2826895 RepID=A0ABT6TT99_9BACL|nr:C-terminal binding protein [Cohnella hashimotonis]MDI4650087.1 C-terminal binding protein [Cohnella hashimotonis]